MNRYIYNNLCLLCTIFNLKSTKKKKENREEENNSCINLIYFNVKLRLRI